MKTAETFGGQKGLLKQEDYSFKTASVVDQICNRFNGLSGDIITLYDAAKFAEEFAAQSVREYKEKLKKDIVKLKKPEIVNNKRIYRDPDFLFGCEAVESLINNPPIDQ